MHRSALRLYAPFIALALAQAAFVVWAPSKGEEANNQFAEVSTGAGTTPGASPTQSGSFSTPTGGNTSTGGNTFSGATGAGSLRYKIVGIGLIDTGGGGATYLPGDTAGTNDGTGVYS